MCWGVRSMKWLLFLLLLWMPVSAQSPQQAIQFRTHSCVMYYPTSAVRSNAQGVTSLEFQVTAAGTVTNVTVKRSSGHSSLDDASVKCVQQWQYSPTAENGNPTETFKQVDIEWS